MTRVPAPAPDPPSADSGSAEALPFGVILAGGESRRYGSPKALADVGGARIIDRVVAALGEVVPDLILSANEPALFTDLAIPTFPDERPGLGALGGIHAALVHARAAGRPGVLAVACDMPFPCVPLLRRLRDEAFGAPPRPPGDDDGAADRPTAQPTARELPSDVVVPESRGRRGIEPLFAAYAIACVPAIEARADAGDRRMISFHGDVRVVRIPLREVESLCDTERAFLNVNTPAERDRAERLARGEP